MAKPKSPRPAQSPLPPGELGSKAGSGQDNAVYRYILPEAAAKLAESGSWVVKISHAPTEESTKTRRRSEDPNEAAILGAQYKSHKYQILKHFLGEHIPDSFFTVGTIVTENGRTRPAEITLQRQVPKLFLPKLTPEQRADPRLKANMLDLLTRLQYMRSIVGEVNARTASNINLDTKLDLGGISEYIYTEDIDYDFSEKDVDKTLRKITSPNILIDPETMQVYCVDFDQGEWGPGMSEAQAMVFAIDSRREAAGKGMGSLALAN